MTEDSHQHTGQPETLSMSEEDWYDHPKWYDVLHARGTAAEVTGIDLDSEGVAALAARGYRVLQGDAEDFTGSCPRQIMSEQAQGYGRHAGAEQGRDLGDKQVAIGGVLERGEHQGPFPCGVSTFDLSLPGG